MGNNQEAYMYVGTYAEKDAQAIYLYRLQTDTGEPTYVDSVSGVANPSFLTIDKQRRHLYAVSETETFERAPGGSVAAFTIQPQTGTLVFLNQQPTHGADPCHLSLAGDDQYLLLVNYSGGNVDLFSLQEDGKIGELRSNIQHHGKGIREDRQEGPHPHSIIVDPSGQFAFVPDLGLDKIITYKIDYTAAMLVPHARTPVEPGSGPRHFVFHPAHSYAYVINELASTITAFAFDPQSAKLKQLQTVPALPDDFTEENTCADIHIAPSGRFLYGSNRGHDSIVVYAIDQDTGMLTYVEHVPTTGEKPRNFAIDPEGKFLFVANQDTNSIVSYAIDQHTGKLSPTGKIVLVSSPVCIKIVG